MSYSTKRHKLWLIIVSLLLTFPVYAQLNNHVFEDRLAMDSSKSRQLFLGVNTLSFIRNTEYFNKIVKGKTLLGYQISPYLSFYPSTNLRIDAGVFVRKDLGAPQFFTKVEPIFTIKYQQNFFALLFGNIEGSLNHRLIEPLYDFERVLLGRLENGFQLQYINEHIFLDTWLDWLALLNKKDSLPEEFVSGMSFYYAFINHPRFVLQLPTQFLLYHSGGQGLNFNIYNLFFGAIGGNFRFNISPHNFLQEVSLENYYVVNRYSGAVLRPFLKGEGFYSNLTFKTKRFNVIGSYWRGNGFSSENLGGLLYQSVSIIDKQVNHSEQLRTLCILRFLYDWPLTDELTISLRFEPYYDFNNSLFEHTEGFYINYRPYFGGYSARQGAKHLP